MTACKRYVPSSSTKGSHLLILAYILETESTDQRVLEVVRCSDGSERGDLQGEECILSYCKRGTGALRIASKFYEPSASVAPGMAPCSNEAYLYVKVSSNRLKVASCSTQYVLDNGFEGK